MWVWSALKALLVLFVVAYTVVCIGLLAAGVDPVCNGFTMTAPDCGHLDPFPNASVEAFCLSGGGKIVPRMGMMRGARGRPRSRARRSGRLRQLPERL
eukprot:COSAG02_NODE_2441_length_8858_cov_31.570271_5_plen_98_part_00